MSNNKKEVIRRLLKGDHLTEIRKGGGKYTYIIGYNGNSPLRVDKSLAIHLIRDSFVECSVGESSAYDFYTEENLESHYMLSTQTPSYETRLRKALKYSLGDTVEHQYTSSTKKHKGIITTELDPLCEEVLIDGIGNMNFSVDNFVGITRMVLVEKKIKNKVVDVQMLDDIPDAPPNDRIAYFDPYDYFDYLYNIDIQDL
jgi:hypothetical protein